MFARIIVGVDEHPGARDAIALAKLLLAPDGHLTLAHVDASDPFAYRGVSALYETREREQALARLQADRGCGARRGFR